jgi:hypothetical protein
MTGTEAELWEIGLALADKARDLFRWRWIRILPPVEV